MSKLEELIDDYIKFEETSDDAVEIEKLNELGHEIDHLVFHEEFFIVYNADGENDEVVALMISDEDENDENFLIPVYTNENEAKKAIEFFINETDAINFKCDKAMGNEIINQYGEDDDFLGLAINAPQVEFVIFSEHVHDCCD